jgi:hypothetical protein
MAAASFVPTERFFTFSLFPPHPCLLKGHSPFIRSCLLAFLCLPVFAWDGFAGFITAPNYAVGPGPLSMATADYNGDGIPDLAVVNDDDPQFNSGTVAILLGNGDGTFRAPMPFAVGSYHPRAIVTDGDFRFVSVLLGNGDGSFSAPAYYEGSISVAVGDFNRDGIVDLVLAGDDTATVKVMLGNGDGTFQAARSYGAGPFPSALAVADFNGDGFPDLAVASGVTILVNDANWSGGP